MKIYEIGTGYTPIPAQMGAATEIVVEELTRSFLKNGEEVEILDIASHSRAENDLPISEVKVPSFFMKDDVSLGIVHKLKRVVYSVSLAKKLKKILKKADEEMVLHFHNQYNMFFFHKLVPQKLRKKAKIAYTVHSYIWGTQWEEIKDTVNKRYFQEVFCVKNADIVFVLNDITTDHFVNQLGVDKNNIFKIINGVSLDKYKPLPTAEVEKIKERLNLSGKKVLFQVGSVCERKNQFGSVEMLKDYLKNHEDVVFMYAGGIIDEEYQQKIINLAKAEGFGDRVIYAGELAPGRELNEYYNAADCSVFTSKLESFGLVIIEAIASGTPTVIGGKTMFALEKGYYAYNDEDEFVSLVDKILNGDGFGVVNSEEVVADYNWDTVARLHSKIFKS